MVTLTLTPTGTVDRKVTEHEDETAARTALAEFGKGYGITEHTLVTYTSRGTAQASYTYVIRDENGRAI